MQSAKDYLNVEKEKKLSEASSITEKAADEGRPITPEEKQKVEGLLSEVEGLKQRIAEIEDNEKITESIEKMRGPVNKPSEEVTGEAHSIGDAFVKSDVYSALKAGFKSGAMGGRWTSGPVELPDFGGKRFGQKVTSDNYPLQPDVQPGIQETLFQRLTVADLLASGRTDSATVRYIVESVATNAAAATAEGDLKPESALEFDQVDEPVRKVATFLPISDEMLEDVSQLRSYLDGRLRLFVQQAEEAQLLEGSGVAPQLEGLLNRTGVQSIAFDTNAVDSVYAGITAIRTNAFVEPDGIVFHPEDWAAIRTAKDANEQYYGGGPFMGPYGNGGIAADNIWGKPVVVTSAIPQGEALVGAFRTQAQVFRRGGLTVEASNSHADFFQRNLTAVRAEVRLALAVYRPAAFATVALEAAA